MTKHVHAQTPLQSFIEAVSNIAPGFVVSYLVWVLIVVPLWNIPVSLFDNFTITCVFTVTSLMRAWLIRRLFNWAQAEGWGSLIRSIWGRIGLG